MSALRYIRDNWDSLGPETATQLRVPLVALAVATAIGLAMGIAGARRDRLDALFTGLNSSLLTIPSLALFGIIAFYVGTGDLAVEIGLVCYALLPVQRNTAAGILAVRPEVVDAARGLGMNARQVLLRVELPLALPVILAGVRQAAVSLVAIATVGAYYDSDNLGRPIISVLRSDNRTQLAAVALLLVGVGLAVDGLLALAQRLLGRGRITALPA